MLMEVDATVIGDSTEGEICEEFMEIIDSILPQEFNTIKVKEITAELATEDNKSIEENTDNHSLEHATNLNEV